MDSAEFFGDDPVDDLGDKDRYGRYRLDVHGDGHKPYTRSTTIAKTLESTYHLDLWKQRTAAKGVAMRPDLVARAAVTPVSDKRAWREILDTAMQVASTGVAKAHTGSAFHQLHDGIGDMTDEQYAAVPEYLRTAYQNYRSELARLGITELVSEVTTATTQIGTAGKVDGFARLADGRVVVIDRKSGNVAKYPHGACVQLAVYANATHIKVGDDWGRAEDVFPDLDRSIGLVMDVDIEAGTTFVYELDLTAGWWAALEACKVRRWRNRKDLLTPYQPEQPVPRSAVPDQAPDGVYTDSETPDRVAAHANRWGFSAQQVTDGDHKDLADRIRKAGDAAGHPAWSSAQEKVIQLANDGTELPGASASEDAQGLKITMPAPIALDPAGLKQVDGLVDDVRALLADKRYKTKAHLQTAARKLDPGMAVNRTRANLASDMVAHPAWVANRHEFIGTDAPPDADRPAAVSSAEDTSWKPTPAQVAQAIALRDRDAVKIVSQTDVTVETSEVIGGYPNAGLPAPEPANPYAAPAVPQETPVSAPLSPEDRLLAAVADAPDRDAIAGIWQSANSDGIEWSTRLQQAADIRLKSLTN